MELSQLCRREVVTIHRNASLQEAASVMRQCHVGALVVAQGDGEALEVVGIVTDRDLAIEVIALGVDPSSIRVGDLAHQPVAHVAGSASLRDGAEAMRLAGVRRLLVVDEEGGVAGLVSADDLLSAISGELQEVSLALDSGIGREAGQRASSPPSGPRLRLSQQEGHPARPAGRRTGAPEATGPRPGARSRW